MDVAPVVDWAPVYVPRAMGDTEPVVQDAVAAVGTMKDISAGNASQPLTVFPPAAHRGSRNAVNVNLLFDGAGIFVCCQAQGFLR